MWEVFETRTSGKMMDPELPNWIPCSLVGFGLQTEEGQRYHAGEDYTRGYPLIWGSRADAQARADELNAE